MSPVNMAILTIVLIIGGLGSLYGWLPNVKIQIKTVAYNSEFEVNNI